MNIIRLTDGVRLERPCAATIGFFDGMHRGHRYLIDMMSEAAREKGLETTVITFDRHPREVLSTDYRPQLLSTNEEKMVLLAQTGVDNCIVIPFDETFARLSAYDFMSSVLKERLAVDYLAMGYDNRFGHKSTESADDYIAYGRELGIEVVCGRPFTIDDIKVSSSVVRSLLMEGEVELAERCMGHAYTIEGTVVEGEHMGTRMGFPTANIVPSNPRKLVPAAGVYGVTVRIDGSMQQMRAMMNIGTRPTFDGTQQTLETHIFRFSGNLYDEHIIVAFDHRLRSEKKFSSAKELAEQLKNDLEKIEEKFETKTENKD